MDKQETNFDRTDEGNQSKGGVSYYYDGGPDSQEIKELKEVLQKLKKRVSGECFKRAERLTECSINKTPIDPKDLLQFFTLLEKESPQKEPGMLARLGSSLGLWPSGSPRVKVFSVVTGQTFGADQVILRQLTKSVAEETRNLQECDVIIVFCSVKSHVGSDVDAAMRQYPVSSGNKPVILVLMYHTRDHDFSPDVTQWSETYPNIKMVSHILFHETQQGLLPNCSRNDRAIQEIQSNLKRFR